ncbi:hypothetical protein O6H91_09G123200 [Diphasiastrum complanatum]|uniref:Uncharacterized protein n=1 Tax=Diphasiastrum complanatum TaxID=34168 RepID=A0ACC2CU77_DIPCM|nr:hypothetical protein O6H91_09G123200 [Diphasiastrum complanatum]
MLICWCCFFSAWSQKQQPLPHTAFNWESHKKGWWCVLEAKVPELALFGFSSIWLPPVTESLAPQGYLPRNLYCLDSAYGSERELRGLLKKLKEHGLRPIADIVVNHRVGSAKGAGDKYNRYDGMPMPWDEKAVTSDTGGHGNPSTGAIFEGVPNIDHAQEFVRKDIITWLRWLRKDVGFGGFRFDFAKGYKADFVKEYIAGSKPELSIGEYWDTCNYGGHDNALAYNQDSHRQRIVDWIDGTGGLSAAFDFTTKAILQEAVTKREWWRLRDAQGKPPGVIGYWPSRAVTFIDNHDTGSTQAHWPFPGEHIMQGYAYIITHPGQPSIFYDHLFEWGDQTRKSILDLVSIRRRKNLHSRSPVKILEANSSIYAAMIEEKVCMKLGEGDWCPQEPNWSLATSGQSYAVWEKV